MAHDHCSDDRLIAFLDGELPENERREVARHLDRCWRCRPRVAELEEQVRHVHKVFADTDHAVEGGVRDGRARLLARCRTATVVPPTRSNILHRWPALIPATTAALALASITTWIGVNRPQPAPLPTPPPAPTTPVRVSKALVVPHRPTTPVRLSPAPLGTVLTPGVDLEELEVDVRFVLHRLGADLGDPPAIRQQDGAVILRGVWTTERREQLEAALIAVSQPDRVRLESAAPTEAAGPVSVTTAAPLPHPPPRPFEQELRARAGSSSRLLAIGNSAVATAERMTDIVWALRRLETRYDHEARLRIAPRVLWLVSAMETSYLTALREQARQLTAQLQPIALSLAAGNAGENVFESVLATRGLLQWLFAGRTLEHPPATLAEAQEALAGHLSGLDARVNARLASLQP